jgi:hypothetical protein
MVAARSASVMALRSGSWCWSAATCSTRPQSVNAAHRIGGRAGGFAVFAVLPAKNRGPAGRCPQKSSCFVIGGVEITARKHGKAQADLDAIRIDIKQGNGTIEVHTIYPSQGPHTGEVSYQVVLPKDLSNLEANTANGSISAQNVSGSVSMKSENGAITANSLRGPFSLSTTNGSINADCTDLAGDGLLHTKNGSITLALPRSADALIDATTTVGRIKSNLAADKINRGVVGENIEARLGAGSHHLEAKTTNGSIRLEPR